MKIERDERQAIPTLRAGLLLGLIAAAILLLPKTLELSTASGAVTLEVGTGGYSSINEAVQAANPGDTIRVHAGTYPEEVTINKPVTIQAFGDGQVVVDGGCARMHGFHIVNNIPTSNPVGVTLQGMTVKDTTSASVMFALDRPDAPRPAQGTVDGMTLLNFDCTQTATDQFHAGVSAWYTGPSFTITNNMIVGPAGGTFGNGIWFKSNTANASGGGHAISGNVISNVWDGIGGEVEGDPRGSFDKNTIIENNTIIGVCLDDGIQVEGGNANVTVRFNDISGCGDGIAFAPNLVGPLFIEDNFIHDLVISPVGGNQFCFKIGNQATGTAFLSRNDCQSPGDGIHQTNPGVSPIVARGNVFNVTRYVYEITDAGAAMDFDHNCLFTTDPGRFVKWNVLYFDLASFQAATGQELTSQETQDCSFLGQPTPASTPTPPHSSSPPEPPPHSSSPPETGDSAGGTTALQDSGTSLQSGYAGQTAATRQSGASGPSGSAQVPALHLEEVKRLLTIADGTPYDPAASPAPGDTSQEAGADGGKAIDAGSSASGDGPGLVTSPVALALEAAAGVIVATCTLAGVHWWRRRRRLTMLEADANREAPRPPGPPAR